MFQKETKVFFNDHGQFGVWEKQIATLRNLLAQSEEFEPYCAFHRIARAKVIGIEELVAFLEENGLQQSRDWLTRVLQVYSGIREPRWQYNEFLRLVLPNDDPRLRAKVSQRNPGLLDAGERLSYEIEFALSKLILTEVEALRNLEPLKVMLMKCKDYSPEQAFFKIDAVGANHINFDQMREFLVSQGSFHQCGDELLLYAIRFMDRDGDGLIPFDDFCNIVYPQDRFTIQNLTKIETKTHQSKAAIISNFINLDKTSQLNVEQLSQVAKNSLAQSQVQSPQHSSTLIHKDICHLLREMIKAERAIELEKQDLALRLDFDALALIAQIDLTGLVTAIRLEEWLSSWNIHPGREHLILFFRRYDRDRDGRLSRTEFLEALQPRQKEYTTFKPRGNVASFSDATWDSIKRLFLLIFQCESVVETSKVSLFQTHHIDEFRQFGFFDRRDTGTIDARDIRQAMQVSGYPATEKDTWLLTNRLGSASLTQSKFFELLAPATQAG